MTRPRTLLVSLVVVASVGSAIVGLQLGAHDDPGPSAPPQLAQQSMLAAPSPIETASTGPRATIDPYVPDHPWLAFRMTAAVIVDGDITAETDLAGWLAGRSDRWFDIESPRVASPIARMARFGGRTVAQAEDGSWSASPRHVYDPWPILDAAQVLASGTLDCVSRLVTLDEKALRSLLSPLLLPAGASGFLAVEAPQDTVSACRITTVGTWASSGTEVQWSQDLVVSASITAAPWPAALYAAGQGPDPSRVAVAPPADAASADPDTDSPVAPLSQDEAAKPGGEFAVEPWGIAKSLTAVGSLDYQLSIGPFTAPQPAFDVAPESATFDPITSTVSLNLVIRIGARDDGFLGLIQRDFTYGLSLSELIVDGDSVPSGPDVTFDGCNLTAQTSGSLSSTCVVEVPLDSRPTDSVRIHFEMTGAIDAPADGHTAFWLTLTGAK